jgi:hypothetical protein
MSNTLLLKRSGTAAAVPASGNLALGELAINYADGNLFYKDSGGTVKLIASNQLLSVIGNVTGGNLVTVGVVTATGNITGGNVLTAGLISATGNVTGNYILGNGYFLTGVITSVANINNGTSNVNIASPGANVTVSVNGTSNVAVFASTGEFITGVLSASGNVTGGNVLTAGLISSTGTITSAANVTGGNVLTGGLISSTGTVTSAANITGGNLLTGGLVSATGTITGSSHLGAVVSVTANVTGGNVLTGGLISATSTITSAANITGGNLLTGGLISATANVTGGNLLTGGLISATGAITGAAITGSSLTVSTGNITGGNLILSGAIVDSAQLDIQTSAANANIVLTPNGTGNVNLGRLSASGNVTVANLLTGGLVSATGTVTGSSLLGTVVSASANIIGGNVLTGGLISATSTITSAANITGGNILTGGLISSTGTITGSSHLGAVVSVTANVTGGNLLSGGLASVSGNITGGNVLTGGLISATGNITGGNVNTPNVYGATGLTISTGSGDLALTPSGNINASNKYINNLLEPAQAQDAATKQYVDDAVSAGLTIHTPVLVESPTALNATYAQGGTTATVTSTVAGNTVVFGSAISPQVNDQYWFTSAFNGVLANTPYFVVSAPNTSAAVLSTSYNGAPVANITGATGLTQPVRINSGIGATLTNAGANATLTIDGVTLSNTNRVLIYTQANAAHNGVYTVTTAGNATTAWQLTRSTDADVYGPKSTEELDAGDYFYVQSGSTGAGESYVMTAPTTAFIIGYSNLTFTQFSASQVYSANTSAGLSLIGTVFNAKVDGITTAFDGGGNISVKASANLTTPNIGAATGTSLSVTGNVNGGNINTGGLISATSTITSAANITGGNLLTAGLISSTGTITGSSHLGAVVSVTANVTGGNLLTGGLISAAANITGGNLITAGAISATGTITTAGNISLVGNIVDTGPLWINTTANGNINLNPNGTGQTNIPVGILSVTANVVGGNLLTAGLISATGTITGSSHLGAVVSVTANVTGGNVLTGGLVSATGTITSAANITGGNLLTAGLISSTGTITSAGNISGANVNATTGMYVGGASVLTVNSTVDGGTY